MGWLSKIKKGIKKGAHKVSRGVKKAAGAVKKVVTKVGKIIISAALFVPLLPFKKGMKRAIRGKSSTAYAGNDMLKLTKSFAKYVLGKSSYDLYPDGLEELTYNYDEDRHNVVGGVAMLIPLILEYFKGLKAKQENGEDLSETELQIIEQVDEGIEEVKGAAITEVDKSVGGFIRKNGLYILGAIASLIVVYIIIQQVNKNKGK